MGKSISRGISKAISFFVFLIVLSGIIFLSLSLFSTSGYKSFTVSYKGNELQSTQDISLPVKTKLDFDCKYTYDFMQKFTSCSGATDETFKVIILPNQNASNFNFTVNGAAKSFQAEGDLSSVFGVVKTVTGFSFGIDKTMNELLQAVYPSKTVVVPVIDYDASYFSLKVSSHDNETIVTINFGIDITGFITLALDKDLIVF